MSEKVPSTPTETSHADAWRGWQRLAHRNCTRIAHRGLHRAHCAVGLARGIAGAHAGPDTNGYSDEEEYNRSRTGTFPVRWTFVQLTSMLAGVADDGGAGNVTAQRHQAVDR